MLSINMIHKNNLSYTRFLKIIKFQIKKKTQNQKGKKKLPWLHYTIYNTLTINKDYHNIFKNLNHQMIQKKLINLNLRIIFQIFLPSGLELLIM